MLAYIRLLLILLLFSFPSFGGQTTYPISRPLVGHMPTSNNSPQDNKSDAVVYFPDALNATMITSDWVESTFRQLTPDERIGQLFMMAAYSNKDGQHQAEIANLITRYKIGGLIFMQGTPQKQAQMSNYFQSISKVPLLMAIDGEWGLSMRLENTPIFPRQMALGAIQDNRQIYEMGREIARQCKLMGIHINFAPVVDVNSNANNPVIGDRSFGEDKINVTEKAIAYMQGMEQNGVMACAKHFPGHGDTDKDSHHTLPLVRHNAERLRSVELYPFQEMIKRGVGSVMVAHLSIPALDASKITPKSDLTVPATLSKKIITNLLKKEMGFGGLVFTDALNMKGVSEHFDSGELEVKALLAGNDVLLFSGNVGKAIEEIKKAIQRGDISQTEIDNRVRRILQAKQKAGLDQYKPIDTNNLVANLAAPSAELTQIRLWENTLTLVRDPQRSIPFKNLEKQQFASIAIGTNTITPFQLMLGKYAPFAHHTLKTSDSEGVFQEKLKALRNYSTVVLSLHQMTRKSSNNYGLGDRTLSFIRQLQQQNKVVLVVFGNAYSLKLFDQAETLLVAYEDQPIAQKMAAQGLFGGVQVKGKLPVTASNGFRAGQGVVTEPPSRFKYTIPEDVGIDRAQLAAIDRIAEEAIKEQATPGCQVFIAKDGKVIWEKGYGYLTYLPSEQVSERDVYDLASVTKIAAGMLGVMNLYENKIINLQDPLRKHIPGLDTTNKANISIRDILIHEAGLKAWIPFYEETVPEYVRSKAFTSKPDDVHSVCVAENMYMDNSYQDMLWRMIAQSDLPNKGEYKYSDLGFYYLKYIIEKNIQQPVEQFLSEKYYRPLGLSTMGYNPIQRFSKRRIAPSENDTRWRRTVVRGTVHDMGAAMIGGTGCHAGLFSNASDLAVLMQMYLNGGNYGGRQYFQPLTLQTFTAQQKSGSRRGLGFDKPEINPRWVNPASDKASPRTFGHTGFTGTCTWADPDQKLVYVFLSNRTYPQMSNNKLQSQKTRIRIQDVIYEALEKSKK